MLDFLFDPRTLFTNKPNSDCIFCSVLNISVFTSSSRQRVFDLKLISSSYVSQLSLSTSMSSSSFIKTTVISFAMTACLNLILSRPELISVFSSFSILSISSWSISSRTRLIVFSHTALRFVFNILDKI